MQGETISSDGLYLPEDALVESEVSFQVTVSLEQNSHTDTITTEEVIEKIRLSTDAKLQSVETGPQMSGGEDGQFPTVQVEGTATIYHTPHIDDNEVVEIASDNIEVNDGNIDYLEHSNRTFSIDHPVGEWLSCETPTDEVLERWFHPRICNSVALVTPKRQTVEYQYILVSLPPYLPLPYVEGQAIGYNSLERAQDELKKLLTSVTGAFEAEETDPVAIAMRNFDSDRLVPNHSVRVEGRRIPHEIITKEQEGLEMFPGKAIGGAQIDKLRDAYAGVDGRAFTLVPDDPQTVPEIIQKAQYVGQGDCVAFTLTTPERVLVFELVEVDAGLRWFRKKISFPTMSDPP